MFILITIVLAIIQVVTLTLLFSGVTKLPLVALWPLWVWLGCLAFLLLSGVILSVHKEKPSVRSWVDEDE